MKHVISQSLGLDLVNINVYATVYQNIPLSLRDRAIFTFSEFGARQTSTDDKCHFAIPWARSCQYQCVCKVLSKYSKRFKSWMSLFSEFEPRQNLDQAQMSFDYLMGYIMSISMCMQNFITTFYQSIPFCLRDRAIFTFSEFGARQSLDRW